MLLIFNNPSTGDFERGLRFVLSAIAFVGVERNPISVVPNFPGAQFLSQDVKTSLSCALHYHELQSQNASEPTTHEIQSQCVRYMTELVDSVYGMVQALATIRAKFQHHVQISKSRNAEEIDNSILEFEDIGKVINVANITAEALAPLAAFLACGVKGLFIYPRNFHKLTQIRSALFILSSDLLHNKHQIEEPIWKRTQNLILGWLKEVMFTGGFESELDCDDISRLDNCWSHKDLSKFDLANAIQLDLAEFCVSRHKFLDSNSESYSSPPFEIPDCPLNVSKKNSSQKNLH